MNFRIVEPPNKDIIGPEICSFMERLSYLRTIKAYWQYRTVSVNLVLRKVSSMERVSFIQQVLILSLGSTVEL